ncbi:helix-turn-helix transcriptional regulator [Acinetobacter baumannii]|nr:helix-turn-helix transcriptional regulator [Acinetobacter baumannii]
MIHDLIAIRESKKITQVELASSLKKPQSYIAKVENFDRRLDVLELNDWLNALGLSIISFLEDSLLSDT